MRQAGDCSAPGGSETRLYGRFGLWRDAGRPVAGDKYYATFPLSPSGVRPSLEWRIQGAGVVVWLSELARWVLPCPNPTPAGDKPPRYIPRLESGLFWNGEFRGTGVVVWLSELARWVLRSPTRPQRGTSPRATFPRSGNGACLRSPELRRRRMVRAPHGGYGCRPRETAGLSSHGPISD